MTEPDPPEPPIDPEPEPPEPEPPLPQGPQRRQYDRTFAWGYGRVADVPAGYGLIPITWDGLPLNTGDQPSGLCAIVEHVDGWLDSPPLEGNDAERSIADGAAWGPKVLGPRTIVIEGAATGPRVELSQFRDQLAARAAARAPGELSITDEALGRTLVADVRGGTEHYRQTPLGRSGFRWQVTLLAADPCLYDAAWQIAVLTTGGGVDTGREYPTEYAWRYAEPYLPNAARLPNAGNHDAPVWALYEGDLAESRLTSDQGGIIRLAALGAQMRIRVATATLTAEAEGGLSRASYVLPGSAPIAIDAISTARWSLYSAGGGSVTLGWRSAWV